MSEDQSREIEIAHEEIPNLPAQIPQYQEVSPYQGISSSRFPPEVEKILSEAIPDEDHDILPTGEPYVPQVHYRRKLIKAFGHGGWALLPRMDWKIERSILFREWALYVNGRYVTEAIGTQLYDPEKNDRMTYAEATESAKSDALKKMCKDLGIASECWDPRWREEFKRKHCVLVYVKVMHQGKDTGKKRAEWRRKDAMKRPYEIGPVSNAPTGTPPAGSAGQSTDVPISEPQMKRLFALLKEAGKTEAELDAHLKTEFKVESKKDIKRSQYEAVCKWIETPLGESEEPAELTGDTDQ